MTLFFNAFFQVTFDDYDGGIGFVNVRNVHWKFVVSILLLMYYHVPLHHLCMVKSLSDLQLH